MQIQEDGRGCHWQIDGFFQKVKCIGKDHLLVQCCCLTGETRFTNSHGEKIGQKMKSCVWNSIHVGEVGWSQKWFWYLWVLPKRQKLGSQIRMERRRMSENEILRLQHHPCWRNWSITKMILIFMSTFPRWRNLVHKFKRRKVRKLNPAVAMPSILEKLVDPQKDSDIYEHLPKMEVLQLDMKSSKIENLKENSKSSLA